MAEPTEQKAAIVKYQWQNEEIELRPSTIRAYLVSGNGKVTDQEIFMFMALCKYQKLNPFLREAYLVKFGSNPAQIITGKDIHTKRASRIKTCKGFKAGVVAIGKDDETIVYREGALIIPGELLVGGWAEVYKENWTHPVRAEVSLAEYKKVKADGTDQATWASMPATMVRKVALVQALREAYPEEFQGMYAPEEMVDPSILPDIPVSDIVDADSKMLGEEPPGEGAPPWEEEPEPLAEGQVEENVGGGEGEPAADQFTEMNKVFKQLEDKAVEKGLDTIEVLAAAREIICEHQKTNDPRTIKPAEWKTLGKGINRLWTKIEARILPPPEEVTGD